MTDSDIELIERELGVKLPQAYREAVVPFRLPALVGNTDYELWDDAERLVVLNRELQTGVKHRPAWPAHLFAVGDPHGDELIGIDLRSEEAPTWWLDHGNVELKSSYQCHASFTDWAEEFYRDLREDLEGDGFDVDGPPEQLATAQQTEFREQTWGCLAVIIVAAILLAAFMYFRR